MGIVKITELKLKKSLYKIKLKKQIITGNKNYNIIIVGKQIKGLKESNKKKKQKNNGEYNANLKCTTQHYYNSFENESCCIQ